MSGKEVLETPFELFMHALANLVEIESIILNKDNFYSGSRKNGTYNAHQAVEKLLKGYLRAKNRIPHFGHNLMEYYGNIVSFDKSFQKIKDDIKILQIYDSGLRYTFKVNVKEDAFKEILSSLQKIYTFDPIQKLFSTFDKTDKDYYEFSKERFEKMIQNYDAILKNENIVENVNCKLHDILQDITLSDKLSDFIVAGSQKDIFDSENDRYVVFDYAHNGNKYTVLEQKYLNGGCEAWQFDKRYDDKSLAEFIRQWKNRSSLVYGKTTNKKNIVTDAENNEKGGR